MHDIWNPWHGCIKKSEGCRNCYMYALDRSRGQDGAFIRKIPSMFDYPLQRDKNGKYKIKSGEQIRVCMTSDFFLPEADVWRPQVWDIMRKRSDVVFFLLTKRPERVSSCLPDNWNSGWENIFFNVTCENQQMADERIPWLLELPFKHKGIMTAPFIGAVSLEKYWDDGQIEQVIAGGENYDGARPLKYEWVKNLYDECVAHNVTFCFIETGNRLIKDNKTYNLASKKLQSRMAFKSGLQFAGKPIDFRLAPPMAEDMFEAPEIYQKHFRDCCQTCGSRLICNGCSDCGKCETAKRATA